MKQVAFLRLNADLCGRLRGKHQREKEQERETL